MNPRTPPVVFRVVCRALPLLAALLVSTPASAQIFSPGPLARAHQDLEGLANCTACHPAGSKLSAEACESCHKEIQTRIQKKAGFHGRLTAEQKAECWGCHHDHQGKNFDMLDWGEGGKLKFPHDKTGWPLEGKHRDVKCEDCHQKRFIEDSAVIAMLKSQVSRFTWLGVPPRCSNCHFDEHRHQLPDTCETCHTPKEWAPAPKFDHNKSRYPLLGAHKKVECKECHKREKDEETPPGVVPKPVAPDSFARYKPVPHNSCLSCHEDPHKGRFGQRCESCHTLNNWQEVKSVSKSDFDHSKTRYPLEGLHARVECRSCHGPFPGKPAKWKGMAFEECTDCHFDGHENQLKAANKGKNNGPLCDPCHTVEGFMPVRFTLDQHDKTKYPLKDAHRAVACNACHAQDATLVKKVPQSIVRVLADTKRPLLVSLAVFDIPKANDSCQTCHTDIHAGQFEAKNKPCEKCHVVKGFKQLTFDHNKDSVFELSGAHVKTACGSCHVMQNIRGKRTARYLPLEKTCAGCHADAHAGQFQPGPNRPTPCEKCHTTKEWKDIDFDHNPPNTRYELTGKHKDVKCNACHRKVIVGDATVRRYKPLPLNCEACHSDFHKGAFEGVAPLVQ